MKLTRTLQLDVRHAFLNNGDSHSRLRGQWHLSSHHLLFTPSEESVV